MSAPTTAQTVESIDTPSGESGLLRIDGLNVAIGGAPILNDISLTLEPGKVLGLVGESGSGKSMTALSVMDLLPRGATRSGRIVLDGEDLTQLSEAAMCERRGGAIGMVFQEPMSALNPVMNIGDQVAETVRIHRNIGRTEALDVARETLNRVGLAADRFPLTRYPHELSGGQRQRVVIAIAIAVKPKLLIADEPTTALDVTTQARVLDLLRGLVDEGGAGLILITHDLAVVAGMADDIAILKDGAVVEENNTLALFAHMRHPYSKALLEASDHRPARGGLEIGDDGDAPEADTPVLAAEGLVRDYRLPRPSLLTPGGTFRAVDKVTLTIGRGENVGLVGESGCGKSTLARMILALDRADKGTVTIDGADFLNADRTEQARIRRHVQVVFQDPYGSFNPRHKIGRLVAEPFFLDDSALSASEKRDQVVQMLDNVGLEPDDMEKYPHEFSGGQRQRIAIARALITHPSLIVLDEAVSALDVSIRAQILDLLADLADRLGVSYLFISHDLGVVRAITDRVLIMKAGKIVEDGPTESVFSAPAHPYTQALIAAAPDLKRALVARAAKAAQSNNSNGQTGRVS
ncbi:MAG: ABC transporter ATP-binding protein [Alphaproteobacteria bacterium]